MELTKIISLVLAAVMCLGMLASYYKTMLFYIDHIKRKFSGVPLPENYRDRPLNPPPMPGGCSFES